MSGELGVVDWSEALSQVFMYRGRLVRFIRGGRHKVKGLPPGRVRGGPSARLAVSLGGSGSRDLDAHSRRCLLLLYRYTHSRI